MAYRANPFLERMSERTTSDHEFVEFFSPKILEKLESDCLHGGVHIFRSPPGAGKTTILRAFTPKALDAFWLARNTQPESFRLLRNIGVFVEHDGPQLLGVFISCASGYADLPKAASNVGDGIFRALVDCRVVLRTLRSLLTFVGAVTDAEQAEIRIEYSSEADDLKNIPRAQAVSEILGWAEQREREIYLHLDEVVGRPGNSVPSHTHFEAITWLQAAKFFYRGRPVAPKRLLMIDDIQKLRHSQREMVLDEIINLRPTIPVWMASRTIAFGDKFISQGVRKGRDFHEYRLEDIWINGSSGGGFAKFAQSILDRRFAMQTSVPGNSFEQHIVERLTGQQVAELCAQARTVFERETDKYRGVSRYSDWLADADREEAVPSMETIFRMFETRILIARDRVDKQMALELAPLSTSERDERDSSAVKAAAQIFANHDASIPYYFGIDRISSMATYNIDELLNLAAELYDGMQAKLVQRRGGPLLPDDQEKRLLGAAKKKYDLIPQAHSHGRRAQKLIQSIGEFCRGRTFVPNAPYAPGVTGVRLSHSELERLNSAGNGSSEIIHELRRVLFECVAENILVVRDSKPTTGREGGSIFYLNRTLCAYFRLPLQYGGWQDVSMKLLLDWMSAGFKRNRSLALED